MIRKHVIDHLGRKITVNYPLRKIVSLVPSFSELICALGARSELSGVTKFCVHPEGILREKTIIGGTKNFRYEKIDEIAPDLIIANKEENYKEGIDQLAERYPVWVSDINTVAEAVGMIREVGELIGRESEAEKLLDSITKSWQEVRGIAHSRVLYFIWHQPMMVAATNTFIHDVLLHLGCKNVAQPRERYPHLSADALKGLDPEIVMLSSEPFPYQEKHIQTYQALFPDARIMLVDGEMFSWYGSRMQFAPSYFTQLPL